MASTLLVTGSSSSSSFLLIMISLLSTLPWGLGLQCHTCLFLSGIVADHACKNTTFLDESKATFRPCNEDTDALNKGEVQSLRSQHPSSTFQLSCLKTVIKNDGLDIVFRGCYSQLILKQFGTLYHLPSLGSVCESPQPRFWQQLRDGPLSRTQKPLDITNAKLEVCLCKDRDGCNSAYSANKDPLSVLFISVIFLVKVVVVKVL